MPRIVLLTLSDEEGCLMWKTCDKQSKLYIPNLLYQSVSHTYPSARDGGGHPLSLPWPQPDSLDTRT